MVTVDMISEITGLPKAGTDPAQYIKARDNDKNLLQQLKERYRLQRDGHAYHIDSINEQVAHIGAHILASKILQKNRLVQCNLGAISCV